MKPYCVRCGYSEPKENWPIINTKYVCPSCGMKYSLPIPQSDLGVKLAKALEQKNINA